MYCVVSVSEPSTRHVIIPCNEIDECRMLHIGEGILISSLPEKASRTLVESRGLSSDLTCILKDANLLFYLSVYKLVHSPN